MYVLEAGIRSNDSEYDLKCYSYAVMIREPNKTVTVDDSFEPNVVIKFNKDFNTVVANRQIEHIKSQFYNCIIAKYGLELTSSISIYAGSVVASASISGGNANQITMLSQDILSGKLSFGMPYKSVSILDASVMGENAGGDVSSGGSNGTTSTVSVGTTTTESTSTTITISSETTATFPAGATTTLSIGTTSSSKSVDKYDEEFSTSAVTFFVILFSYPIVVSYPILIRKFTHNRPLQVRFRA